MAQTEAQLKARLLKLADEMAALAKRGQEIHKEYWRSWPRFRLMTTQRHPFERRAVVPICEQNQ